MRIFIILSFFLLISNSVNSRKIGETEITTEDGIEVFQDEKYYLLKKNVQIESDNFKLFGDKIKIFFEKDLYDIQIIDAEGNVKLVSSKYDIKADGKSLFFKVNNEEIIIKGKNSKLVTKETKMFSDGEIQVNNISGKFLIVGENSSLESDGIFIESKFIDGIFSSTQGVKDIIMLDVKDDDIAYVNTDNTEMYANIVKYNKETSLIELENNVKIIRDGETITGDYGTLDTRTNSYKVKSKNSNKVKVIILSQDE